MKWISVTDQLPDSPKYVYDLFEEDREYQRVNYMGTVYSKEEAESFVLHSWHGTWYEKLICKSLINKNGEMRCSKYCEPLGATTMKWISVKDKLPEPDTEVLVYSYYKPFGGDKNKYDYLITLRCLHKDTYQWRSEILNPASTVTHWQILEPPQ